MHRFSGKEQDNSTLQRKTGHGCKRNTLRLFDAYVFIRNRKTKRRRKNDTNTTERQIEEEEEQTVAGNEGDMT